MLIAVAGIGVVGLLDRGRDSPIVADGATEASDRSTGGASSTAVDQTAPTSTTTSTSTTTQTSAQAGTPTSETDPAPTGQEAVTEDQATTTAPASTLGLRTSTTRTSEWEDGYCFQVDVTNQAGNGQGWRVVLDLGGSVDTVWNATVTAAGDQTVFSGQAGYNTDLAPGASTSFGACVTTNP